jgi:hypothetical protein
MCLLHGGLTRAGALAAARDDHDWDPAAGGVREGVARARGAAGDQRERDHQDGVRVEHLEQPGTITAGPCARRTLSISARSVHPRDPQTRTRGSGVSFMWWSSCV